MIIINTIRLCHVMSTIIIVCVTLHMLHELVGRGRRAAVLPTSLTRNPKIYEEYPGKCIGLMGIEWLKT